ncbi:MAG: hypothetical protein ACOC3V_03185 [bacterium]
MKKYISFIRQEGEGCDYTIGCGINLIKLKSTNMDDATQEMKEIIKEQYNYSEAYLEKCTIYEVTDSFKLNTKDVYSELKKEKEYEKKKQEEEKERKEYERLMKKFGDMK